MPPGDVAPDPAGRVVLVVHVPDPVVVHQPVGVVRPVPFRCVVQFRTVRVGGQRLVDAAEWPGHPGCPGRAGAADEPGAAGATDTVAAAVTATVAAATVARLRKAARATDDIFT